MELAESKKDELERLAKEAAKDYMTPDKEAEEFGHSELTLDELTEQVELLNHSHTIVKKPLSEYPDEELKRELFIEGRKAGSKKRHDLLMDEFMRRNKATETPEEKLAREEYLRNRKMTESILAKRRGPKNTPSQKSKRKKR